MTDTFVILSDRTDISSVNSTVGECKHIASTELQFLIGIVQATYVHESLVIYCCVLEYIIESIWHDLYLRN
jgi:hypothetical protein